MAETITAKNTAKEAAPKKLTIAEILAQRAAFEAQIKAQLDEERPAALDSVKEQIATFTFTADELGFGTLEAVKAIIKAGEYTADELGFHIPSKGAAAGEKQTRNVHKPIKSSATGEVSVWLANPPKFLDGEGCYKAYTEGKSIDAWLVDATKDDDKAAFLAKLMKHTAKDGKEKEPTKDQLGTATLEAVKAARAKLKAA